MLQQEKPFRREALEKEREKKKRINGQRCGRVSSVSDIGFMLIMGQVFIFSFTKLILWVFIRFNGDW